MIDRLVDAGIPVKKCCRVLGVSDLIDRHTEALEALTARIEVMMEPFKSSVT